MVLQSTSYIKENNKGQRCRAGERSWMLPTNLLVWFRPCQKQLLEFQAQSDWKLLNCLCQPKSSRRAEKAAQKSPNKNDVIFHSDQSDIQLTNMVSLTLVTQPFAFLFSWHTELALIQVSTEANTGKPTRPVPDPRKTILSAKPL